MPVGQTHEPKCSGCERAPRAVLCGRGGQRMPLVLPRAGGSQRRGAFRRVQRRLQITGVYEATEDAGWRRRAQPCGQACNPCGCDVPPSLSVPGGPACRSGTCRSPAPAVPALLLHQFGHEPHRFAAFASRRDWTRTSGTLSSWSTAGHRYSRTPLTLMNISSRCHLSPAWGQRRRKEAAYSGPNFSLVGDDDLAGRQQFLDLAEGGGSGGTATPRGRWPPPRAGTACTAAACPRATPPRNGLHEDHLTPRG